MNLALEGVGAKHSGAATVLLAVARAALDSPGVKRLTVFASPRRSRAFDLPADERVTTIEVPWAERGTAARLAWHQVGVARYLRKAGADVVLLLGSGGRSGAGVPSVLLVQQSLPFSAEAMACLDLRSRVRARALGWSMHIAARGASAVAVQTATMKAWVESVYGIPGERVGVFEPDGMLPEGQGVGYAGLAAMRSAPEGARFLYVGNSSAYKNLAVLGPALDALMKDVPQARLFATVMESDPLAAHRGVVPLGYLPGTALAEAYGLATALVMPSLVETVGLPMLEAMRCGLPVIAADRPYAREVCEDAAVRFDPLDPADLARQLVEVSSNGKLRNTLAERGRAVEAARTRAAGYRRLVDLLIKLARAKSERR